MRTLSLCLLVGVLVMGCPSPNAVEQCVIDCHSIGAACNPMDLPGRFSASACEEICREPNSRLVLFPDCFPCLETEVACDVTRFFDECVPVYCWDPEVYNDTGMAVPPPGR